MTHDSVAVPILTYHSLDESGSVISTPPATFRRQMQTLAQKGYVGIRLDQLLDVWDGSKGPAGRPVVLTFDDGFTNVLEHAVPILTELGFSATVFAVAGHCGGKSDWATLSAGIPILPLLSWTDLAQLTAAGFEVGAHSLTHAPLTRSSPRELEREIIEPKKVLEDRLGASATTFAYPYGLVSRESHEMVKSHYRGACGVVMGAARRTDDRHRLRRIDMYYLRDPAVFRLFGTLPGRAYLGLRATGRGLRGAITRYERSLRPAVVSGSGEAER